MASLLRGWSFHSVKGGVGRSYLALKKAMEIAQSRSRQPVYLLDMDLTGTSLADGLPLCAPILRDGSPLTPRRLENAERLGFFTVEDSRARITQRNDEGKSRTKEMKDLHVPFLNDFLLHVPTTGARSGEADVALEALCWKLDGGPQNLHVLPSSACPGDIERILPLVNDEEHAAFIEARLECLLARLLEKDDKITVVFDCARGIHGVSRSVLSLGLRLSASPKESLAVDGWLDYRLEAASVTWAGRFVTSTETHSLVATRRWLDVARTAEKSSVQMWVNDYART